MKKEGRAWIIAMALSGIGVVSNFALLFYNLHKLLGGRL